MARDWATTLFRTSYNGVPFWVEADDLSGGRRLVKHQVAGSDDVRIEDFGGLPSEFSITAYTVGDAADVECLALVSALEAGGSGIMLMAADGPVVVWPERWRRNRARDRMGYFALDISVTRGSVAGGYALGIGMIASAFAAGLTAATSALGSAFR